MNNSNSYLFACPVGTFNPWVVGSSPAGLSSVKVLGRKGRHFSENSRDAVFCCGSFSLPVLQRPTTVEFALTVFISDDGCHDNYPFRFLGERLCRLPACSFFVDCFNTRSNFSMVGTLGVCFPVSIRHRVSTRTPARNANCR